MKERINSNEFVRMWASEKENVYSNRQQIVNGEVIVKFENLEISGDINIYGTQALLGLNLKDCTLRNGFYINSGSFGSLYIENTTMYSFYITSGTVKYIAITDASFVHFLKFQGVNCGHIYINHANIGHTIIKKSNTNNINIYDISEGGIINIENTVCGNVTIVNSKCEAINIYDHSNIKDITIDKGANIEVLDIGDSTLKNINVTKSILLREIGIRNSIAHDICIKESQISNLDIIKYSKVNLIEITSSRTGWLSLEESEIRSININSRSSILGVVLHYLLIESKRAEIKNCYIHVLIIRLDKTYLIDIKTSEIWSLSSTQKIILKDSILKISDTKINEILFDSFINQGIIVLNNIYPLKKGKAYKFDSNQQVEKNSEGIYQFEELNKSSIMKVVNSDLGKTTFIGCDINQFDRFEFSNSKILDVFVADTILPKKEKIFTTVEKNTEYLLLEQRRLALSQFKKIYENRGDIVNAIEYHAHEMETYRECLSLVKPSDSKEWWNNFSEKINLNLNRYSSYHGNNWLRAVVVTLSLNFAFFTAYCWSLGYYLGTDGNKFIELFSYSFEFLNPLRKADFLKDVIDKATPLSRIIDYTARIFIAYFVYQTIQAFRKFGKKSV